MPLDEALKSKLDDVIHKHKVVLFMKGNKHFPQCGFSAQVVGILKQLGAPFETVNVLSDQAIREGIKEYSSWPTIPQLYVDGEFLGGCDIVKDMFASGELQKKLGVPSEDEAPVSPPDISIDDAAAKAIKAADEGAGELLRLEIDPQFSYELYFDQRKPGDLDVTSNGVTVLFDRASARRANGLRISWVETGDDGAFRIENPNEPPRVKPLSVAELSKWMMEGKELELVDVRTEQERRIAKIERDRPLDVEGEKHLLGLSKDTPVVFYCHSGVRSRNVAERFVREGFKKVYNLEGGIDAWSVKIDPKVPRY